MKTIQAIEIETEIQSAREELARQENIARIHVLKKTIAMNERALPHLSGIPARHAQKRIDDARAELQTCEFLEALEKRAEEDKSTGAWSEAPLFFVA